MAASPEPPQLATRLLRTLTLNPQDHPRGLPHMAAASGLVCAFGRAHAIGEDEHHPAVLRYRFSPGQLHRVRGGALPANAAKRKRLKTDFESLPMLPARCLQPGTLLALNSGSERRRDVGVTIALARELEVEGLALHPHGGQTQPALVTDADDPMRPAALPLARW